MADRLLRLVFLLVVAFAFALPRPFAQGGVLAEAAFDSAVAETGDDFTLHLSVSGRAGQPDSVAWNAWNAFFPKANRLRESGWQFNTANRKWENTCILIAFDSLSVELPPLPVVMKGGKTVATQPLRLTVVPTPSPADPADLFDIREIRVEPVHWTDYLPWIAGAALVLLGVLAYAWWRSQRQREAPPKPVYVMAPHEAALTEIDALEARRFWESGQAKYHYDALSAILRRYLAARFELPLLESTTRETLRMVQPFVPQEAYELLKQVLEATDLVKFAKGMPPVAYHTEVLQAARTIVRLTQPQPVPAP